MYSTEGKLSKSIKIYLCSNYKFVVFEEFMFLVLPMGLPIVPPEKSQDEMDVLITLATRCSPIGRDAPEARTRGGIIQSRLPCSLTGQHKRLRPKLAKNCRTYSLTQRGVLSR